MSYGQILSGFVDFHLGLNSIGLDSKGQSTLPEAQIPLLSNLDPQHPTARQIKSWVSIFSKPMPLEALIEWTSTAVANNG